MFGDMFEDEAADERRRQEDVANQRFGMKRSREDRMDMERPKTLAQRMDDSLTRLAERFKPAFVTRYQTAKIYEASALEIEE